jgi:hypothetical protein
VTIISAILAILQDIPTLDKWFQELFSAYMDAQLKAQNDAFANAQIAIVKEHDQTLLEKAIGSKNAGLSSLDQTDIVDRPLGAGES